MTAAGMPARGKFPVDGHAVPQIPTPAAQKNSEVQVFNLSGGPVFLSWYAGTMAAPFPTPQDI
jgi:hypothetical protein